jgi:ATP-dependent protease ClpP protease subunit
MIHDDNIGEALNNSRVVNAIKDLKQFQRYEEQWNKLMAESTTTPASTWNDMHQNETYLTPGECLTLGIIGGII